MRGFTFEGASQGSAAADLSRLVDVRGVPLMIMSAAAAPTQPVRTMLRVAMLAPPWIPVPPDGYGGIEAVVSLCATNWWHADTT